MRAIGFAAVLTAATAASAGSYLEVTHRDIGSEDPAEVQKMWFDGDRFRNENDAGDVQIFKDRAMYLLDTKDESYTVIDQATLERVGGQMAEMKKKLDTQMAGMTPQQRAMVEKALGGMGAGAQPQESKRVVRATSRTESAAGRKCVVWEVIVDGRKEQELCAAPANSLPGGTEVLATMKELGATLQKLTSGLGSHGRAVHQAWTELNTVNGIPVISRDFEDGKAVSEAMLTTIRSETAPASAFEIPKGYKRKKTSLGSGGM